VLNTKQYGDDHMKNEMGKACGTYGELRWGNQKERTRLEDLSMGGRIILREILYEQGGISWTGLIWLGTEKYGLL